MTTISPLATCSGVCAVPASVPEWLHVVTHLDPKYGGLSAAVPEINAAVAQTGEFRTCLAGFCDTNESQRLLTSAGFRVEQFDIPRRFRPRSNRDPVFSFRDLVTSCAGVHIHGLWTQSTALAARFARAAGKPYVISAHGMLERWALRNKRLKKTIYLAVTERANLAGASCLHALTEGEAEDYRRLGLRNRIAVIPNGVTVPENASPQGFLQAFPRLSSKRLVLFLGRIHFKKGLDILVQSWSQLAAKFPDVHLVLAGPDFENTRGQIETQIARAHLEARVSFTGMLANDLKWSALAASELFVLPSYSEGLSVSVLEAMGVAQPVLITKNCNLPEVSEHRCGWVIKPEAGQLEAALEHALRLPPDQLATFGSRGRQLVEERYNWVAIGRQMSSVYRWITGGPFPTNVPILREGESR